MDWTRFTPAASGGSFTYFHLLQIDLNNFNGRRRASHAGNSINEPVVDFGTEKAVETFASHGNLSSNLVGLEIDHREGRGLGTSHHQVITLDDHFSWLRTNVVRSDFVAFDVIFDNCVGRFNRSKNATRFVQCPTRSILMTFNFFHYHLSGHSLGGKEEDKEKKT